LLALVAFREARTWPAEAAIPWAEENQGLLSLGALVVALSVAVYETRRALRAGEEWKREFADQLLQIIDSMMVSAVTAVGNVQSAAMDDGTAIDKWQEETAGQRHLLDVIRHNPPRDVVLAVAAQELWSGAARAWRPTSGPSAQAVVDGLKRSRTVIAARR
jgi:hypothetical protein